MIDLIKQLTDAAGVSGAEKEVRTLIRNLIRDVVDEWHVDALGNLIAIKKGTGESGLQVMVDAHMDEIGLIITAVDGDGSLQFAKVGGIDDRVLAGAVVQVGDDKVPGVIGLHPFHLISAAERGAVVKGAALRIDLGGKNPKIKVGDRAVFINDFAQWDRSVVAKALDNRVACAALIDMLKRDRYPFDLIGVFSVQEEAGMAGVQVATRRIQPDVAIVLECTPAYDLPNDLQKGSNTKLGAGPCVYVMDSRTIHDPRLVQYVLSSAETHSIPVQIRRPGGGGTHAGAIQSASTGVPVVTIGLPERYAHTANSLINLDDFDNYIQLIDKVLRDLHKRPWLKKQAA